MPKYWQSSFGRFSTHKNYSPLIQPHFFVNKKIHARVMSVPLFKYGKKVGGNSGCLAFPFILECLTGITNVSTILPRGNWLLQDKTTMFTGIILL